MAEAPPVLVIACGALANEIQRLKALNGWEHIRLQCLDAGLHNTPKLIPEKLREKIRQYRDEYEHIFVGYGDCGTAGGIDRVLEEYAIERLPGAHCYSFYAGSEQFNELHEEEPGTFYLTDYLARNFERLIVRGLKLDVHPELHEAFFGNYRRVVYLSQQPSEELLDAASRAAEFLDLELVHRPCGYGDLETGLNAQLIAVSGR